MKADFLHAIIEEKKKLLHERHHYLSSIKEKLSKDKYTSYHLFKRQITKPGQINLIAEIKKASPSKGMLREEFDILEIAKIYVENHAAAISVLTEEKHFLGKPIYVKKVSDNFAVPVLAKDFFIDEGQIYEARFNGASAILLIVAILKDEELKRLMRVATNLDLDCLVEVHTKDELKRALDIGAEIIGINNRDLVTFNVDLKTSEQLIAQIPKDKVIVVESGIQSHKDVAKFQAMGAHAVLIGETFMRENNIANKIKEVMYGKS